MSETIDDEVEALRERVAELEAVVNRELGASLGPAYELPEEPQTLDCVSCGEEFEVTVSNGTQCPHCGTLQSDKGGA